MYMRLIKIFIMALSIFFIASRSFGETDISVEAFISKNTFFYPEVNLLVFNKTNIDKIVEISFSLIRSDATLCKISAGDQSSEYKNYLGRSFFSDFGQTFNTSATIAAHSFAHRFIAFGSQGILNPCKISYVVKNKESQQAIAKGVLDIDNKPQHFAFGYPKAKDLNIDYTVEKVIPWGNTHNSKILTTILITNTSSSAFNFNIAQKKLIGCTSIAFDKNVLQGMDGSNISVSPFSYGVALILLTTNENQRNTCHLEVQLKDIYDDFEKAIKIPIEASGAYSDLTPFDPAP